MNIESNEDKSDDIFWLAIVERWPPATWNSLTERALYQARRLHQFARGSGGGFVVIESSADLSSYLEQRSDAIAGSRLDCFRSKGRTRLTASWRISMFCTAPAIG